MESVAGKRVCSVCKVEKQLEAFRKRPSRPPGRDYRCLDCVNLKQREKYGQRKARNRNRRPAMVGEKKCARCRKVKSVLQFHVDRASVDGRRKHCRSCMSEFAKRANKERPEIYRAIRARAILKRRSLTPDGFAQLLASQGGGCAICGRKDHGNRTRRRLFVDHNHDTNQTRGILCSSCNHGLGHFKDDQHLLAKAIKYLSEYEISK